VQAEESPQVDEQQSAQVPIEGQVARILNRRELVINRGRLHGVEPGMQFAVLNTRGSDITDPETGDELGSVSLPKVLVKVVRVQDRLSIGRTFRQLRVSGGGFALPDIFRNPRYEPETLDTTESTYQEEIDESESYVKRGDPVIQVLKDEYITG
jgi:hypothetical protein